MENQKEVSDGIPDFKPDSYSTDFRISILIKVGVVRFRSTLVRAFARITNFSMTTVMAFVMDFSAVMG